MNWLRHVFWWLEIHTGTVNEGGPYYGFFSGFGSDIGEITLVTGVALAVRHHNCHTKGCWRLGKPVVGTHFLACPKHHPAHPGDKRNVPSAVIRAAHWQARNVADLAPRAAPTPPPKGKRRIIPR